MKPECQARTYLGLTTVEKGTVTITGQRGKGSWNSSRDTTERAYAGVQAALGDK